jgi:penicillin-binding protein 1A
LGITAELDAAPSLPLGTSEVTLIELTSAYASLASGGFGAVPYGIAEIRVAGGEVIFRRAGSGFGPVVAPDKLAQLNRMLQGVIERGTGRAAQIGRPAAGKTGTSQSFRDAWFVGYTADLAAGVWLGNDDSTVMPGINGAGVTGGGLPARLWAAFMTQAHDGLPVRPLTVPALSTTAVAPGGPPASGGGPN